MDRAKIFFLAGLAILLAACAASPVIPKVDSPVPRVVFEDTGLQASATILERNEIAQIFGQRAAGRGILVVRLWVQNGGGLSHRIGRGGVRLLLLSTPDGKPEDFYTPINPFRMAGLARAT